MASPNLPTDVLDAILWLASPRLTCYTQRGRHALISLCLTCRTWKNTVYGNPRYWTSLSIAVHDIIDLNAKIPFMQWWYSKAGTLGLSLDIKEFKEREYVQDARRNTPKNLAKFKPAYKFILKYSARWERIHFDKVRFSWINGLALSLPDKNKFIFKKLTHFGSKATGRYIENVLPLHEMPKLRSLAIQGQGEFVQLRARFSGIWDRLRNIEMGLFASVTVHLRILQECRNLREFTLRGDSTFWYLDRGEFDEDVILEEAAMLDIVLPKVHTASFVGFVYTNAIVNSLTLPSLTILKIIKSIACTGTSSFAEQRTNLAISELVKRSKCSLQELELCCISIDNERAIKLLKRLPSLSRLYLEAADIDCTFLSSLKDELHLLETLQLKVINDDPKAHAYSEFVEDPRRWWTELDERLVETGYSRGPAGKRFACLGNTFLEISPGNEEVSAPDYTRVYIRGFDNAEFAEGYEDKMLEDTSDNVGPISK